MIIIRMQGGIGNQLFQYALYCEYQFKKKDVRVDFSLYKKKIDPRRYGLTEFAVDLPEADQEDINRLLGIDKYKIKYLLPGCMRSKTCYYERQVKMDPKLLELDERYLIGYFQSEKYFIDVREQIRKQIGKLCPMTVQSRYYSQILAQNAVSVHVRLGDYLKNPGIYGGICTKEYYRNAIELMKQRTDQPVFFIFSDDIAGARRLFANENCIYIENAAGTESNQAYSDVTDLQLMSLCNHNIIANSSFSWWGAWLNSNKEKSVIAPDRWMNDRKVEDIWCEDWIII